MAKPIIVHADWDPEAEVWVATTQDLRGLVTEASSIEALRAKLKGHGATQKCSGLADCT